MAQATQAARAAAAVSSHYASQAGLSAALGRLLRPTLDRQTLYALLTRFSRASATVAARDYAARRAAAGIRSAFTVPLAAVPSVEHMDRTLNYVYSDAQGVEDRMVAAFTRLVLQSGRMTVVEAVQNDPQARAWAREARPGCCSFCAMLASRGAVYKSEGSAGRTANEKFVGEGDFKFHNHCHCVAVPVFGHYEPTAHARQWRTDWYALKRELGHTPSLNQWRQHIEGRPVDGLTTDLPAPSGNGRTAT